MNNTLHHEIKYGTNIITEEEYLDTIVSIADVATEMVEKTLGPFGRTTIIDDGTFTYPTKDGWNVLKRLHFNDPIYNTIYNILKQTSFDLASRVGDGTTSAFVGANIFIHKILEHLDGKIIRQADFLNDLNYVVNDIVDRLKASKYVRHIQMGGDYNDIYELALIASNGNEQLANAICDIYRATDNPNIYVTLDPGKKLSYDIQKGYKYDCNPINQKAYRNTDEGKFLLNERSMIAIFDHNVNYTEHGNIISGISRFATAHQCTIFILAPQFDDIMLNIIGTSINSMLNNNQVPNIMLIQIPLANSLQREYLKDIVLLTNAQLIDYGKVRAFNVMVHNQTASQEDKMEDALLNSDQYKFNEPSDIIAMCVGKINKIVVDKKYLLLQEYATIVPKNLYQNTLSEVSQEFSSMKQKAEKSSTPMLKEYLDAYQHYTKLVGNLGVIYVGGESELEKMCLKDAVDDAVLACRSATEHGYVRGLNLAMLNVIQEAMTEKNEEPLWEDYALIYQVIYEMTLKVFSNCRPLNAPIEIDFEDGEENNTFMFDDVPSLIDFLLKNEYGFDLVREVAYPDEACKVVNSVSTDIEILRGMVSVLSTVLTSNQFLSINRSFDRAVSQKQKEDTLMRLKKQEFSVITEAIIETLKKHNMTGLLPAVKEEK